MSMEPVDLANLLADLFVDDGDEEKPEELWWPPWLPNSCPYTNY